MTWGLTVESYYSFTQIRFDDPDAAVLQEGRHLTLFLEHRLALDQFLNAMIFEDGMHDLIVLGSVQRPVDVRATFRGIGRELFQVTIKMSECMFLDLRGNLAKLLPLR